MKPAAANARTAILAALPREVAPLVRGWPIRTVSNREGTSIWESDRAIVVCAGMGRERVTRALELAESRGRLESIISVGYAGALRAGMQPGKAYWPAAVIDGQTGERFECSHGNGTLVGEGTLVTTDHAVGRDEKLELAARWNADLVDMEAAAVARLAQLRSLPFRALRAVSDRVDDNVPDLGAFTDERGGFRESSFARYVALHPWLIPTVMKLGKQSAQASQAIARALRQILQQAE
jgi:adenosylhomocysteine nucleosidase